MLDLFHQYKAWCTEPQIFKTIVYVLFTRFAFRADFNKFYDTRLKYIVLYSVAAAGIFGLSSADFICHSYPVASLLREYEVFLLAAKPFIIVTCWQQSLLPDSIRGRIFRVAVIVSCLLFTFWLITILRSSLLRCQECLVIGLQRRSLLYHLETHTPRRICHV